MTITEYNGIKAFPEQCSNVFVSQRVGLSSATVSRVRRSKDFSDYKKLARKASGKYKEKSEPKKDIEPLKIVTAEQMNHDAAIREAVNKLNEIGIAFHNLAEYLFENFCKDRSGRSEK